MPDYFLLNSDGTTYTKVTLEDIVKANPTQLAWERDVQTVKDGAKSLQDQLDAKVKQLTAELDSATSAKLTAESLVSEKDKELEPLKKKVEDLTPLEAKVKELTEKVTAAETQALTSRRKSIINTYGIKDEDKIKEIEAMDSSQLDTVEKAAKLFGDIPASRNNQNNFDRNNNQNYNMNSDDADAHDDLVAGLKEIQRVAAGFDDD